MGIKLVQSVRLGRLKIARLSPGSDLFPTLEKLMQNVKIRHAVIVSAIGSLENVSFRNLKENIELPVTLEKTVLTEVKGPLELLTLEGSMMPMDGKPFFHLHGIFGTTNGRVVGGHMFAGRVYTTLEISFAEMKNCTIVKARDKKTGLPEYFAPPT